MSYRTGWWWDYNWEKGRHDNYPTLYFYHLFVPFCYVTTWDAGGMTIGNEQTS